MPLSMEICLEEMDRVEDDERFVRCVAMPGGEPGLSLDRKGEVRWMSEEPGACGLWISADHRLILRRAEGSAQVAVERGDRSLDAPIDLPVVLLRGDILRINDRRLRVHVHGETEAIHAPERLSRSALSRLVQAAAASAALALGTFSASTAGADRVATQSQPQPIEVRLHPPGAVPRKDVICTIDKQKAIRGKGLRIEATCPTTKGLNVGLYGRIIKAKTHDSVPNGTVQIKSINGKKIVAEASKLKKPVRNAMLLFYASN